MTVIWCECHKCCTGEIILASKPILAQHLKQMTKLFDIVYFMTGKALNILAHLDTP